MQLFWLEYSLLPCMGLMAMGLPPRAITGSRGRDDKSTTTTRELSVTVSCWQIVGRPRHSTLPSFSACLKYVIYVGRYQCGRLANTAQPSYPLHVRRPPCLPPGPASALRLPRRATATATPVGDKPPCRLRETDEQSPEMSAQRNRAPTQPCAGSLAPRVPRHLRTAAALTAAVQGLIDASPPRAESQTLHAQLLASGLTGSADLSVKLLVLHLRCGSLHNARAVFDGMPSPTRATHNYLVAGYFRRGRPAEALGVVRRLAASTGRLDVFSLSMALKLSAALALPGLVAREVHARVLRSIAESDEILFAALVDAYVKSRSLVYARRVHGAMPVRSVVCSTTLVVGCMNEGLFEDAEAIFEKMEGKDVVAYNAMVEGYSKTEETAKGSLEMFKAMQRAGLRPTVSTFVSVLGACSLLSSLELGEQVHCQGMKSGLVFDIKVGSALVDMYAKCGRVEDGRRIFNQMAERNVITWTSMIDGYGKNGLSDEALQLFGEMRERRDVRPNHATFLSILSACAYAGLLSQGQEAFLSMESEYLLRPRMEHYACMVDLLGRFGSVRQAYDFIQGIPVRPNSDVWAALLGAATLHGDMDMANIASREVFELSRKGRPGAYMAFSNTLAAAGKWDGVHDVREIMKQRGVLKDTACSWVGSENSLLVD